MENSQESEAKDTKRKVKGAIPVQPPTQDSHITTAVMTTGIARNIYETLVTLNGNYEPVPLFTDDTEASEVGKQYTFYLREGVNFHNAKEMIAKDVVTSMYRWHEIFVGGKLMEGATFSEVDDYLVLLTLDEPIAYVLNFMADRV